MRKAASKLPRFERSSGNVFADLGFRNADVELAKAKLVVKIGEAIKIKGLSQQRVAAVIGIDQPKVSMLLKGRTRGFSTDRLLRILTQLGCDIDIKIKSKSAKRSLGQVRVSTPLPMSARAKRA